MPVLCSMSSSSRLSFFVVVLSCAGILEQGSICCCGRHPLIQGAHCWLVGLAWGCKDLCGGEVQVRYRDLTRDLVLVQLSEMAETWEAGTECVGKYNFPGSATHVSEASLLFNAHLTISVSVLFIVSSQVLTSAKQCQIRAFILGWDISN